MRDSARRSRQTSSSCSAGPLAIAPDETIGIDAETVERLLSVQARTVDVPTVAVPEDRLADAEAARRRTPLDAERQNEEWLEAESSLTTMSTIWSAPLRQRSSPSRPRLERRAADCFDKCANKAANEHAKHGGKPWSCLLIPVNEILANAALDGGSQGHEREKT